jgi:hypothetical protein
MRINIYLLLVLCLTAGFLTGYLLKHDKSTEINNIKEIYIKDSVEKIKYSEPIYITKVKTKIIKTSDSQIVTNPFISKLDTIINQDTISAIYEFPDNLLSIKLNSAPDTMILRKIEIIKSKPKEEQWWEVPLYITGGIILGFLIGSAGK